jgi:hypothetical protein
VRLSTVSSRFLRSGSFIYDESTPEYRKFLRDRDYWTALDRTSGDRLVIFTLADKEAPSGLATLRLMILGQPGGDDLTSSYSLLLKKIFHRASLLVYPSILFFQVWHGRVYDYRLVPLSRGDVSESFKRVQDLFSSISEVLGRVTRENFGNRREIYHLVEEELHRQKCTLYVLQGPSMLRDLVGLLKTLVGFFAGPGAA